MYYAYLDFGMARVFVEIPDVAVVAVRKPVAHDPLVFATVAATFRYDTGYQRGWTDVHLKPLICCKQHYVNQTT